MPKITRTYKGVVDHTCAGNHLRLTQAKCCGTCAYCTGDGWCDHPDYRMPDDEDESWLSVSKSWLCDKYEQDDLVIGAAPNMMLAQIKLTKTDKAWLDRKLHEDVEPTGRDTHPLREWTAVFPDGIRMVFALQEAEDGTRWCDVTESTEHGEVLWSSEAYFEDYARRYIDMYSVDLDLPTRHDVIVVLPEVDNER